MKHTFAVIVLLCVFVFVEEICAAPAKDKKIREKKHEKSVNQKYKDTTEKNKKQVIPGLTTEGNPDDNSYTGYQSNDPSNTIAASVDQQEEDIFNKPVQLVQVKDLDIKNGVIRQSDVVEG